MPGLIGYTGNFDTTPDAHGRDLLARMAHALESEALFQTELLRGQGYGLGRVSLNIVHPQPQPVWTDDGQLACIWEGEIFNAAEIAVHLTAHGVAPTSLHPAELCLALYRLEGEAFPIRLNGSFALAIWDTDEQRLVLINDRLGLHPLYYAVTPQGLLFGNGVRALLAARELPRRPNLLGIAQFLTFDHLLDDNTLLQDVKLLPQSSVLCWNSNGMQIKPYWRTQYPAEYELRSEAEWGEQFLALLRQAVRRQSIADEPLGILFSGGMDSRILLGLLAEKQPQEGLKAFTWGLPGCDDLRFAREAARSLGIPHHFFALSPDYMQRTAERSVRATDGMGNLVNLHAIANLDEEREHARIVFKGFLGDAMMGFAVRPQHFAEYDDHTAFLAHREVHISQGVINYMPDALAATLSQTFQAEIGDGVWESYRQGMAASRSRMLADQRLFFDYNQRVPRMAIKGVEVTRTRMQVRLPFADNDLMEWSLGLPPGLRYERRVMKMVFLQNFPALAQIPLTWDNLPLANGLRDIRIRFGRMLRWHLHHRGLRFIKPDERRPYADYNGWFRGVLRPWVEDLLLSPRAVQRGYFQPEAVRGMLQAQYHGQNHKVHIGAMLALELWHRLMLD